MISTLVFALTVLAGGVFAGAFFRKDFGDALPLSVLGILFTLYLSGLLGILRAGVWAVVLAAGILLGASVFRLIREKQVKAFLKERFGADGLCFLILFVLLLILNVGRVAWHYDEFSHWMDCVKAMSRIDDFAANAALSHSDFASYPPGMALFEYFFEKLHLIFDGTAVFSEWRVYVAFQLFSFSMFFPVLKHFRGHRILKAGLFAALFLIPLIMYPDCYSVVLIDPAICNMTAAGYLVLLTSEKRSLRFQTLYLSLLCAALTLMKDAGIFFAVFLSLAFIACRLAKARSEKTGIRKAAPACIPLLAALAAKGSWKLVLNHFQTPLSFSAPLRIGEYIRIFFLGGDTTYRQETVDVFKWAFINPNLYQVHSGITTSYAVVLGVLLAAAVLLTVLLAKKGKKQIVPLSVVLILQTVLYIFFLGAVYISKFSEYEATIVACYERYVRIAYLPLLLTLAVMALDFFRSLKKPVQITLTAAMAAGMVLLCSFQWLGGFVTRGAVRDSQAQREPFRELQETIESVCSGEDEFFCITGDIPEDRDAAYERFVLNFIARPNRITAAAGYLAPESSGGPVTARIPESCTYVIIHETDEQTRETFRGRLRGAEELQSCTLYRINREEDLLERVEP